MKIFEEAIKPPTRRALEWLRGADGRTGCLKSFYLAGGTGLALQMGHRYSVDLDFFSRENPLSFAEREALLSAISTPSAPGGKTQRVEPGQQSDGTMYVKIAGVDISFIKYSYPLLEPSVSWNGIYIAGMMDIALMKLAALVGRGHKKDFVDVYCLAKDKHPLQKILMAASKKFPNPSDFIMQVLRALVYFDDAADTPMPEMLMPVSWNQVESFFKREVPLVSRVMLKNR